MRFDDLIIASNFADVILTYHLSPGHIPVTTILHGFATGLSGGSHAIPLIESSLESILQPILCQLNKSVEKRALQMVVGDFSACR